ncbi:MAG: SDR family oxidoreductase [Oscillospiraceae bacterium]|nr:SDR family oxidoreductase [Oscillospiraceae bacterium]
MSSFMEKFSLCEKKALVISPENPYGKEVTEGLRSAGAEIWLAGENRTDIECKGFFDYERGNPESAEKLEKNVREVMGHVDVVVENGMHTSEKKWEHPFETIQRELEKTHLGMMLTIGHLGHILAEQKNGSIILITDYGALVGYDVQNYIGEEKSFNTDFSVINGFIKGGVVNYARQASNFLAEHGCRCNAIAYAPMHGSCDKEFESAFIRHSQLKRLAYSDDVASAVVFLASDASSYITGITLPVDGGYTAK